MRKNTGAVSVMMLSSILWLSAKESNSFVIDQSFCKRQPLVNTNNRNRRSIASDMSSNSRMVLQSSASDDTVKTRRKKKSSSKTSTTTAATKTKTAGMPNNRKKGQASTKSYKYYPMLEHELLTKDEDLELGEKIQLAKQIQESIDVVLAKKERDQDIQQQQQQQLEQNGVGPYYYNDFYSEDNNEDDYYDYYQSFEDTTSTNDFDNTFTEGYEFYNQLPTLVDVKNRDVKIMDAINKLTDLEIDQILRQRSKKIKKASSSFPLDDTTSNRSKLQSILLDGSNARDKLIRSNVRLVVSIAKKWALRSVGASPNAGTSVLSTGLLNKGRSVNAFSGDLNRPSYDEAIQEGLLGLIIAVEKYDFKKQLRFSTYATYWITNYIRRCYQTASTGCLRIPANYYDIKQKYKKTARKYYDIDGELPAIEVVAADLGISVKRLLRILRFTQPLISIDSGTATSMPGGAGKAGSETGSDMTSMVENSLLFSSTDPEPDEYVERTLLRQCLENAMATELSPSERDIIRLRLGLDDGVSRTVREIVEMCDGALTMTDVRNTEQRAFKKLRSPFAMHTYELYGYFEFAGIDTTLDAMQ